MQPGWKVLIIVAIMLAAASFVHGGKPAALAKETAFSRVLRTNELRCGYIVYAPYFQIDPATGKQSGLAYDTVEALGQELGVKILWVEETGWGTFQEGLNANRYDMLCTPIWESGVRARAALLTRPVYIESLYAFARADDNRFDLSLEAANKKDVIIADYEGDITQKVREQQFPLAQDLAHVALAGEGEYLMSPVTHKADLVLAGWATVQRYNVKADIKLKAAAGGQPVRRFSAVLAVRTGEHDFKALIDSGLHALAQSGQTTTFAGKYEGFLPAWEDPLNRRK